MESHDGEPAILVRRSTIDADVWFCITHDMNEDQSDWEAPGRVRAVKRYAEEKYRPAGHAARWVREDSDTWRLVIVEPLGWPERR